MTTLNEKLDWIVRFAMWSDAAIAAEISFVGAYKIKELPPIVFDELELFGLTLTTQINGDNIRTFDFEKGIEDNVQKVLVLISQKRGTAVQVVTIYVQNFRCRKASNLDQIFALNF